MPLIPAFRKQKQEDLCEFKASLVYRVSSRTAKATQRTINQITIPPKKIIKIKIPDTKRPVGDHWSQTCLSQA